MGSGKSFLVELEDGGQFGKEEAGEDYSDLIEATKSEVGRLKSNGSEQAALSDALEKIDWVNEHLKTQKKSKKYKEIFHRALGVIKSLYKKLQKQKNKKHEGKGAADYFESRPIIEDLIYASRGEAEIPAEIPSLTEENRTEESRDVPMNKLTRVSLTESISASSQEPPIIHTEDPSQTTESPLEKGVASTTELARLRVTVESVESKSPVDEIPLSKKCDSVPAMTDCNSRCTKGKIRCKGKLKNMAFHGNLQYFSSKKLSDSKYVSTLDTSNS